MNVSQEADKAFMEELQRTDRPRYDRLIRAMEKEAYRVQRIGQPESQSSVRHFVTCAGCGHRFLAKRADNSTCSARCRARVSRKSQMSQIAENTVPIAA